MNKKLSLLMVIALVFSLLSSNVFGLVTYGAFWGQDSDVTSTSIFNGETITVSSGAFYSASGTAHVTMNLLHNDGSLIKTLYDQDVSTNPQTGFVSVPVNPNDYSSVGSYFVHVIVSDNVHTNMHPLQLTVSNAQCNDGIDNDNDGATDHPADFGCANKIDNDESDVQAQCQDGIDNDLDGYIDLDDPACNSLQDNSESPWNGGNSECSDDQDNDGDGYVDLGDPDCSNSDDDSENIWNPGNTQCSDNIDNDNDGLTDLLDPGCENLQDNDESDATTQCQDNQDNDGDGLVDMNDPGCANAQDDSEGDGTTQCQDGIDNDGDNYVDQNDPGCSSPQDNDETHFNQVPVLMHPGNIVGQETDLIQIQLNAFDQNNDDLTFATTASFGNFNAQSGLFTWQTDYDSEGVYVVQFSVEDSLGASASIPVQITITDLNRVPVISEFAPLNDPLIQEGESQSFSVVATDADSEDVNNLEYIWTLEGDVVGNSANYQFNSDLDSAGTYDVVVTVSDGKDQVSHAWVLNVENVNQPPVVNFIFAPVTPGVYETVLFVSQVSDPENDLLSFSWDFNGDGVVDSNEQNPEYVYSTPKTYTVTLSVSDGEEVVNVSKEIVVVGALDVEGLTCFENVIENKPQSCIVDVTANNISEGEVSVSILNSNDEILGTCVTDSLTGACSAVYTVGAPGVETVHAIAQKDGFIADLDVVPNFTYNILEEKYVIDDLTVYSDSDYSVVSNEFFRNEFIYIKFRVLDSDNLTTMDLVTDASLVSPPGGMVDFLVDDYAQAQSTYYYYALQIPPTHDFLGSSQVFTFAFNFEDGSGAEEVVELSILNNLPVIDQGLVGEFENVVFDQETTISLTPYESDVEDSGDNLTWNVIEVSDIVDVVVDVTDVLTITPLESGSANITLVLSDLDLDTDSIEVTINTEVIVVLPQCSDGIDNDFDNLVDFPADPGCSSADDDDETNQVQQNLAPVAVLNVTPSQGYVPLVVAIDGSGSYDSDGEITSYSWIIHDDGEFFDQDLLISGIPVAFNKTLNELGNYTIQLIVVDDDGAQASTQAVVLVLEEPIVLPQCSDGIDNDFDNLTDLEDPGCSSAEDDDETDIIIPTFACSDGLDNDFDGYVDLDDSDCDNATDDSENNWNPGNTQCSDNVDNDGDGFVDLDDSDCDNATDDSEDNWNPGNSACSDGIDNDSDGLIDLLDPGCENLQDNDEFHVIVGPQCSDNIDNDGDGLIDLQDPNCMNGNDDSEGFEQVWDIDYLTPFVDLDDVFVNKINFNNLFGGAVLMPGDLVSSTISFENNLDYDIEDIKVRIYVEELDVMATDKLHELESGENYNSNLVFDIPQWATPGVYDVRIVVHNDDIHRVKYRTLEIR